LVNKSFASYRMPIHNFGKEGLIITSVSAFCTAISQRTNWQLTSENFRNTYPHFNIDLLVFNQYAAPNNFAWQERLILNDALELVTMAVNSTIFENEMSKLQFTENDGTTPLSSQNVISSIRKAMFSIIISKNDLAPGVAAEATIGGISHTIWFRNDKDYSKHNVIELAVIIGHELTHNLGYKHSSGVPYGVHIPILLAVHKASQADLNKFIKNTPFMEDIFLTRVRSISPQNQRSRESSRILKAQEINLEQNIKKTMQDVLR
ncbi:MAG: hypothetical protein ACRCV0_04065, partial [Brevinema sp.]